jgi:hypothetical protein
MGGCLASFGERNKCIQNIWEESRGRWKYNIRMKLQKVGWERELDCYGSEYGAMAGGCECSNESSGSIKCREFLD